MAWQLLSHFESALKIEGSVRNIQTHAAGVIISKDPLDNTVPIQRPPVSDADAPPLTATALTPGAVFHHHAQDHLADWPDTQTRTPLRAPRLREEIRDVVADVLREHIHSAVRLPLKEPADKQLTALLVIGIPRRPPS